MCGIVGYVGSDRSSRLGPALQRIRHRGPDAEGQHIERVGGVHVGLGHVRLSVLDLSEGARQPFLSADRQHALSYNGEIYNHAELRTELQSLGWVFRTHSDTEVLLAGLANWGLALLPRLDGIFAFAWLDNSRKRLTLVRDRLGVKPLYVHRVRSGGGTEIHYASEIKALSVLADRPLRPDRNRFAEFLLNGFLYEPASGIEDVEKLFPGSWLGIDLESGRSETGRYCDPVVPQPGSSRSSEGFGSIAETATRSQSIADVKVGLSFSGGIDSSVLAMAGSKDVRGLFVSFAEDGASEGENDDEYARAIAQALELELDAEQLRATTGNPSGNAEDAVEQFIAAADHVALGTEEPISNFTYVASEQVARMARRHGFTVLLSGMGGDELFAGYPRHRLLSHYALLRGASGLLRLGRPILRRSKSLAKKADRLLAFAGEPDFGLGYSNLVGYFGAAEVTRLLGGGEGVRSHAQRMRERLQPVAHLSRLRQGMYLDQLGFLAQNLTVTDKSAMAQGIEVRVPLLSNDVLDYASRLPDEAFAVAQQGKKPLRDYLLQRLPRELVHRKKLPFNPPLDGHVRRLGADRLNAEFRDGPLSGELELAEVRSQVAAHFSGAVNNTYRLWQLFYFSRWLRTFSVS